MGKQVRIISISFMEDCEAPTKENPWAIRSLEQMEAHIRSAATPGGQDLILLPEFWAGPSEIQALDGQITTRMQELAR